MINTKVSLTNKKLTRNMTDRKFKTTQNHMTSYLNPLVWRKAKAETMRYHFNLAD